ncbi:MAG: hypothetical protein R3267_03430 [Paenisporosarcina sp.]|nr:hypothetical protein [Paenisporosarcina sp.]
MDGRNDVFRRRWRFFRREIISIIFPDFLYLLSGSTNRVASKNARK